MIPINENSILLSDLQLNRLSKTITQPRIMTVPNLSVMSEDDKKLYKNSVISLRRMVKKEWHKVF